MAMSKGMMIMLGILGIGAVAAIAFAGGDAGETVAEGQQKNPETGATASWKITKVEGAAEGGGARAFVFHAHFQISGADLMTLSDGDDQPIRYATESDAQADVITALVEQGFVEPVTEGMGGGGGGGIRAGAVTL